jgi:hypothetical protein
VEALLPASFWKKASSDLEMWLHESRDLYYAAGNSNSCLIPHPNAGILCVRGFIFDTILAIGSIATGPYEGQVKQAKKKRGERHRFEVGKHFLEFNDEPDEDQAIKQPEEAETYRFATRRRNKLFTNPCAKVAQREWEDLAFSPWDSRITQHSPYAHEPERVDAYCQTIRAGVSR